MNAATVMKLSKNCSQSDLEKKLKQIGKDDDLLSISTLMGKRVDFMFRKMYLKRIKELFTISEIAKKWNTDIMVVLRFFINNNVSCFDGDNSFERVINLLFNHDVSKKSITQRIVFMDLAYTSDSICSYFNIHHEQYTFYLKLFDVKGKATNENKKDLTKDNNFSLVQSHDKIDKYEEISALRVMTEKEVGKETMFNSTGMITQVDKNYNVISTQFVPKTKPLVSADVNNKSEMMPIYRKKYSIIRFLDLPYNERKFILNRLIDEKKISSEIETQLGIPSSNYFRKIKARHMIFDFHNKDKIKNRLASFKSFEDAQKFLEDIWKDKKYEDYDFKEDKFRMFIDEYFDIKIDKKVKKTASPIITISNFEAFRFAITKQAVYCFKKNSRITNLTQEEVDAFENDNRTIVSDTDLNGIIKDTIKASYEDKQRWVSIFDFKTAIEKKNFNIEDNQRIEDAVDALIEKKFFVNEFGFIVKKVPMENPVLSKESSIRYEFVEIAKTAVKKEETTPKAAEIPIINDNIKNYLDIVKENETEIMTEIKNFILDSSYSIDFDENNIEKVTEFIINQLKLYKSGRINLSIKGKD